MASKNYDVMLGITGSGINNKHISTKIHNFISYGHPQFSLVLKSTYFVEKNCIHYTHVVMGGVLHFSWWKMCWGWQTFDRLFFLAYSKTVWMARRQCNRPPCCCSEFWSFKIHLHFDAIQVVHYSHQLLTLFFLNDLMVSDLRMNGFEKVVDDWFEYWV